MRFATTTVILAGAVALLASPLAAAPILPDFSAATFTKPSRIDSTFYPLVPGTVFTCRGAKDDGGEIVVETVEEFVTWSTRTVDGVTARVVRAEVLSIKEMEFVVAAHSIGTRQYRIIFRHVFSNVLSPVMVAATLGVANAIITESALSFLGLGFPSDFPTWGRLLFDGKDFLTLTPSLVFWPGLFISLTVLSVNFIGDGLRDALDPRIRGR